LLKIFSTLYCRNYGAGTFYIIHKLRNFRTFPTAEEIHAKFPGARVESKTSIKALQASGKTYSVTGLQHNQKCSMIPFRKYTFAVFRQKEILTKRRF
jgi:hypothetical protein